MNIKIILGALLTLFVLVTTTNVSALPAFARKNNIKCSSCHTTYPTLTPLGRQFKEAGYRFTGSDVGDATLSDYLQFDKNFPMSLALVSRPYNNSKLGTREIRAIHEGELYAGGEIYKNVSGFLEIEAEGEDGFGLVVTSASITYNQSRVLNIQTGYGPTLMADPYDTYADMRRLTASHYEIMNQTFGGADNADKMRHARQQVSVYGRPLNNLFYYAGVGGLTEDKVGSDSSIYFARLAFDITQNMMVGGMLLKGSCKLSDCTSATQSRDFSRLAIDGQFEIGHFRLTGVYMQAKDDSNTGIQATNNGYYIQAIYHLMENGRPTLVPLLRLETYEKNNGQDKYSLATANITYYFTENVKGFIEYQDTYDAPTGVARDNITTLQAEIVF